MSKFADMKKNFIYLLFVLIFINTNTAQERNCGTMMYLSQQIEKDPNIVQKMQVDEAKLQSWITQNKSNLHRLLLQIKIDEY